MESSRYTVVVFDDKEQINREPKVVVVVVEVEEERSGVDVEVECGIGVR